MDFITREILSEITNMANCYPVVTIVGPRQSGKTTVVKQLFPNKPYITLEDLDERELADNDPRGFLARFPKGAILDEIQRKPELLSYIQGIVDSKNINGMFILTGSHQLSLRDMVSQSLAGRTAILKLLPLTMAELSESNVSLSLEECLLTGMYPRIFKSQINPTKYYRDYIQTYVERDVRNIINIKDLKLFQNFLKLCASRIGQVFNAHNLSNELGVSHNTIKNWLSVLEASFLVFTLAPYYENFGKRVIKSPKLYFTDVGLASYLLDIHSIEQVSRDPLKGSLVENLVILEFVKTALNRGIDLSCYYYRDSNNKEVDLLIKDGANFHAIEIKSSKTFHSDFLKGLTYFKNIVKDRYIGGYLIYAGEQQQVIGDNQVVNFYNINKICDQIYV